MAIIRTGYSFRAAVGHIDDVMSRLVEIDYGYAPITDRASTFGFVKWQKEAKKAFLKPVYGVELAVTDSINEKRPSTDYWTFIAIDDIKYINQLVELATTQFRYTPLLDYEQAQAAEGVIKIAGSRAMLHKMQPADGLFVGLAPSTPTGLYKAARRAGFSFLATSDNKYPREKDFGLYEVICGRDASSQTYPQHILSDAEWRASVDHFASNAEQDEAIAIRNSVLAASNAKLRSGFLLTPKKPTTLRAMCEAGAVKICCDISRPDYKARLDHELKMIAEKDFEDYFYIIADMMQWARAQLLCGPARGSSCGSLVCYLLEITTIDPLKYDLIFERFIDVNRADLPDIDLDFSDNKRHMVFEYMEKKYGKNHVARLGTVALYKPKSAIGESAAALGIPKWKADKVLDSIIERSSGDSRAMQAIEDTFNETAAGREFYKDWPQMAIAGDMEGHPRHHSQHAAGIILTQEPVINYVAIDSRTGATHCDKKDAEELNLLKIDALGLTQLSVFEDALAMAGLPFTYLDTIPLDDPDAFRVINEGRFAGIFQYNGLALQSIAKSINTRELNDIVSTTALSRPGPMASGGTNQWIKRHNGLEKITYPHALFEPYLKKTLGIVAYQEQVLQIGREIGDLSWADVTSLRRAMSKSLGEEFFNQFGDKFKEGAIKKGIPAEDLTKIWTDLCAYGSWAFNLSHSVAYGMISYQCCWMKAHYPFEYAAATLQHEVDPAKQIQLLREMDIEGIKYIPVDINLSTDRWQAATIKGERKLVGPVQNVKGVGPKKVSQIMSARKRREPIPDSIAKLLLNPKTDIDSLWPIRDAVERLLPDRKAKGIVSDPSYVNNINTTGEEYEVLTFAVLTQIRPRDENDLANVAKRGFAYNGPSQAINLQISDDTGTMFAKIGRWEYEMLGKEVIERGKAGKAIYAIKGSVPKDFRMIRVKNIRYIGDME
jgi:DNA polymerase III alpha subunit